MARLKGYYQDNKEAPSLNNYQDLIQNRAASQVRGSILKKIQQITTDPDVIPITVGVLNKVGRAKILLNRATSFMDQEPPPVSVEWIKNTKLTKMNREVNNPVLIAREKTPLVKDEGQISLEVTTINLKQRKTSRYSDATEEIPNNVNQRTISQITDNNIHLVNKSASPYIKLTIQGMPSEIECNPESSWAVVKSIGRNNPFYVFTGSEDTISFDISWYSNNGDNREDVINKCKLLESWTKADGYKASPPVIEIVWGKSGLFEGQTFILHSAKYKLGNFQNSFRHSRDSKIIDAKLLPNHATQALVFKKITQDNTSTETIIPSTKLSQTPGIKIG